MAVIARRMLALRQFSKLWSVGLASGLSCVAIACAGAATTHRLPPPEYEQPQLPPWTASSSAPSEPDAGAVPTADVTNEGPAAAPEDKATEAEAPPTPDAALPDSP